MAATARPNAKAISVGKHQGPGVIVCTKSHCRNVAPARRHTTPPNRWPYAGVGWLRRVVTFCRGDGDHPTSSPPSRGGWKSMVCKWK